MRWQAPTVTNNVVRPVSRPIPTGTLVKRHPSRRLQTVLNKVSEDGREIPARSRGRHPRCHTGTSGQSTARSRPEHWSTCCHARICTHRFVTGKRTDEKQHQPGLCGCLRCRTALAGRLTAHYLQENWSTGYDPNSCNQGSRRCQRVGGWKKQPGRSRHPRYRTGLPGQSIAKVPLECWSTHCHPSACRQFSVRCWREATNDCGRIVPGPLGDEQCC